MSGILAIEPFGVQVPLPVVTLGVVIGITYGLLAVGLVLVYRANRIINFAHGEIGAFAAAVFGLLVGRWDLPYWLAFPIVLATGGVTAAGAEVLVVRRLRNAPKVMSIVATLGIGQFLLIFSLAINSDRSGFQFPQPPGLPEFALGALRVTQAFSAMLLLSPVLIGGVVLLLRRSRVGIAMRAAAANPDAAAMAGIPSGRMSSAAWALAGLVSAFTAVLVAPTQGIIAGESFGPSLLLRALAAAVVARMSSLPMALGAGVGLGVLEQVLLWNYPRAGLVEAAIFAVILVALLLVRRAGGREEELGSWAAVQGLRPIPRRVRALPLIRRLPAAIAGTALAVAVVLPLFITNGNAITIVAIFGFGIVGLSAGIVTGLAGQLSLGQFALAAIGATASYHVAVRTGNYGLSLVYAGLAAAGVSLLIGLPALRLRGLLLAVTTLGFALVVPAWLLQQDWMLGEGVAPGRPIVFGIPLDTGKRYYWFALTILVLVFVVARNVRRSGLGDLFVAVRDNEANARAFAVKAGAIKMQAFLLAGFLAGLGGAVYGHGLSRIGPSTFLATASVDIVVFTVIGGLGMVAGPLVGAVYFIGIPAFVPLDSAGLAATRLGALIVILYLPGGIVAGLQPIQDRIVSFVARRHGIDLDRSEEPLEGGGEPSVPAAGGGTGAAMGPIGARHPTRIRRVPDASLLSATGIAKRFGGVHAVDGVSVEVSAGETLGIIGPNGAGKTTLFEVLSGFTHADDGVVIFDGRDVSGLGPEARGRLGLIRSFQDAALFPTMTVSETLSVALTRLRPVSFVGSILGLQGSARARATEVDELISFLGLGFYRDAQIQELSTGTRRITELACLVALRPTLLLLDEPASGVAQRETEALGDLLRALKAELDATLIVIEHDIPLIMDLADRIMAMDAGRVLTIGSPNEVRHHPDVVEAYLGGSVEAIERSGHRPAVTDG